MPARGTRLRVMRAVRFEVEGESEGLLLECDDDASRARFVWRGQTVRVATRDAATYGAGGAWGATAADETAYAEWFAPGTLGASDEQLEARRERERAQGYQYERRAWERFRRTGNAVEYELIEGGSAFAESWGSQLRVTLDLDALRGTLARRFSRSE